MRASWHDGEMTENVIGRERSNRLKRKMSPADLLPGLHGWQVHQASDSPANVICLRRREEGDLRRSRVEYEVSLEGHSLAWFWLNPSL